MRILILIAFSVLAMLNLGPAECAGFYHAFEWSTDGSYKDLGTLSGGTSSWAYANNYSGQAVGWSTNSAGENHAVRWESNGSLFDLGSGIAYGMNDLGQAVGTSNGRAIFWDVDGTKYDIGSGVAEGVNNHGQVVGRIYVPTDLGQTEAHAFVWSTSAGLQDLGKAADTIGSAAHGINDAGWICGTSLVNNDWAEAFVWNAESGWTILGDGSALSVNDAGQVAGNSFFGQAFTWSSGQGQANISGLTASALNASGQLVGYSRGSGENPHAALWQDGLQITDLGVPTGYLWSEACDINDQGKIVGAAMAVPEPSSVAVLLFGLVGAGFLRRR